MFIHVFPGVLFALKVITTYMLPPGFHYLLGFIPVPSRYAVWAELGLIHVLVPQASFIGTCRNILHFICFCFTTYSFFDLTAFSTAKSLY